VLISVTGVDSLGSTMALLGVTSRDTSHDKSLPISFERDGCIIQCLYPAASLIPHRQAGLFRDQLAYVKLSNAAPKGLII
jgi:hypothetical protein